jgi:cyclopropane-fatty-acyl-phospholipid synthase
MTGREEKQLQSLKKWIEKWAPDIDSQLSVRLWNGDILPLGPNAKEDILFAINSPEAVRRLIFSPRLMTLFELYAENLIDIEGGTPLEASYR